MSDFQVLAAVREHLLKEGVTPHVHLALPPEATYPLVLIELEEMWSAYPARGKSPDMKEAVHLSDRMRKTLEGRTFFLPDKTSTLRFLACVAESSEKTFGSDPLRAIHHFYDGIIRG
ncbi:MAG: hypothetical protein K0R52_839 [Alphaproteobacteria bacterium]|nr:hypothetical protein [Alphaproteobacteria bacterium]